MLEDRKRKLLEYLYPTKEIAEFMIGDLYVELTLILDKKTCFSSANIKKSTRASNLVLARQTVKNFLIENPIYKTKLEEFFPKSNEDILIDNIISGYVMIKSTNVNKGNGADVFWDKRSVCYSKNSIIDIL